MRGTLVAALSHYVATANVILGSPAFLIVISSLAYYEVMEEVRGGSTMESK